MEGRYETMELLQLRYFLVAAKYEHITKAAQALRIAQPALSQSIKRLEAELGVPLFIREKRTIRLNAAGKFLERQLLPLMASLDELPEAVRGQADQSGRTIHLNLLAASRLVTNCIIAYKKLHPETKFRLSQNPNMEKADLLISTTFPGEEQRENSRLILQEAFYMAVSSASPYAGRSCVALEDVKDEGFISLSNHRPIRRICDRFCLEAGFTPRTICETDNPESVRNLIAAGLGVGFWPEYSWGLLFTPQITLLPIHSVSCRRDITLSCCPGEENRAAVEDFCRFLSDYANSERPSPSCGRAPESPCKQDRRGPLSLREED